MEPALVQQLKALRVLQPLALLAFIGATILTSISILPVPTFQSGADVSDNYLTALTPVSAAIGGFWGIIILAQIGGLAVLLLSGDVHKQRFLVVVPGRKLAGVNLAMTGWTLAWSTRYFLLAELFLLVALGCTVLIFLELVRFHARVQASKEGRNSRDDSVPGTTMDEKRLGWTLWATVELPVKMMLAIMLLLDLWQNGLLAIGFVPSFSARSHLLTVKRRFYKYVGPLLDQPHGRWEPNHETHGLYIVALVTLIVRPSARLGRADEIDHAQCNLHLHPHRSRLESVVPLSRTRPFLPRGRKVACPPRTSPSPLSIGPS